MLVVCIGGLWKAGGGVGSPGCVVHVHVWRLCYVVDNCNVVATEHGVHEQCWVCIAC